MRIDQASHTAAATRAELDYSAELRSTATALVQQRQGDVRVLREAAQTVIAAAGPQHDMLLSYPFLARRAAGMRIPFHRDDGSVMTAARTRAA
jgi:hypothetical protein